MLRTRTMGRIGAVILGFLALNTGVAALFGKGYSYRTWWHGLGFGPYLILIGILLIGLGIFKPDELMGKDVRRKRGRGKR